MYYQRVIKKMLKNSYMSAICKITNYATFFRFTRLYSSLFIVGIEVLQTGYLLIYQQ